jgi:hypothetical protein
MVLISLLAEIKLKKKNEGIESTLVRKRVYESFTVPKLVMEAN